MITIRVTEQKGQICIMQMQEADQVLCEGQIKIGQPCELLFISQENEMIMYNMGKALLHLAERKGMKEVFCKEETIFPLLTKLGFQRQEETMVLSLEGYFSTKCKK